MQENMSTHARWSGTTKGKTPRRTTQHDVVGIIVVVVHGSYLYGVRLGRGEDA